MKKVLLSLGLVASVAGAAQAQAQNSYGLKAGGSLTNYIGNGVNNVSYKFGFHGGIQADLGVNDHFSVHPEVLFSMKGSQVDQTVLGLTSSAKQTLYYIDVPVMARIKFSGLFVELGPQIGVLLKATSDASGLLTNDIKGSFSPIDFGYAGGIGYQMANGPGIGARYFASAVSISSTAATPTRNNGFQLYVSYLFGGK